jgi:hypothetical protein
MAKCLKLHRRKQGLKLKSEVLLTWIVYDILKKDIPIIVTNSLSFTLNTVVIILWICTIKNNSIQGYAIELLEIICLVSTF